MEAHGFGIDAVSSRAGSGIVDLSHDSPISQDLAPLLVFVDVTFRELCNKTLFLHYVQAKLGRY
jgi:hypothetical protein